jgi:hypothetical protein
MASTTIKLSTETRDRIKARGGDTYEETIVEALDALEESEIWAQADRALAWRQSLPDGRLAEIEEREAELDRALDGLE